MTQTLTAKIKLCISAENKTLLDETMSAYRKACNYVSAYIFETHDLKQFSLNKQLYRELRSKFGLKAQMAQSVLKTVIAKYKTILTNQGEWIQPVFKVPQLDLVWNRDYSLVQDQFSVNTLNGRIKIAYIRTGNEQYLNRDIYHYGTARLIYKHNKYYLHIPVSREIPDCDLNDVVNVVGIDRGINFLIATYDSQQHTGFVSGKQIKQKRANFKALRRKLQKIKTPSSRRRLKAIGQRENRWMNDVNHCISKALVERNPAHTLFVLEDLSGIRAATEKVCRKNRYQIVSWSYYDLEQKLSYKASAKQSKVIKVDPRYTSQRCPQCGHTEKANRNKKIHLFRCKHCGYCSNDDRIAAMNLYAMGMSLVPHTGASK